jgi:hypothetical protein
MACAHEIHTSVSLHMPFFLSSSSIPGISAIFPPYTNCSTLHHNSQGPQIHLSTGVSIRRHIFLKRRNVLLQTPNSFHQYNESFFYLFCNSARCSPFTDKTPMALLSAVHKRFPSPLLPETGSKHQ